MIRNKITTEEFAMFYLNEKRKKKKTELNGKNVWKGWKKNYLSKQEYIK